jgi:hypothetical protein
MEPSLARISEPGGIRFSARSVRSRVVFAASWTPAARSSLVAFWEVAVPTTGPSHAETAAARTQVFPVPAGPVTISTVRAEVSTARRRRPGPTVARAARRARVYPVRHRVALPREWLAPRPHGGRPSRLTCAARPGSGRTRPGCLPGSAVRRWRIARCRAGCTRCARPADGAATQGAAAIAGLPGTPLGRPARTGPHRPGRAAALAPPAGSSVGFQSASPGRAA